MSSTEGVPHDARHSRRGRGETARGYGITVKLKLTQGVRSETMTTTYHEFKVGGHLEVHSASEDRRRVRTESGMSYPT
jgi:hypothetical protein